LDVIKAVEAIMEEYDTENNLYRPSWLYSVYRAPPEYLMHAWIPEVCCCSKRCQLLFVSVVSDHWLFFLDGVDNCGPLRHRYSALFFVACNMPM